MLAIRFGRLLSIAVVAAALSSTTGCNRILRHLHAHARATDVPPTPDRRFEADERNARSYAQAVVAAHPFVFYRLQGAAEGARDASGHRRHAKIAGTVRFDGAPMLARDDTAQTPNFKDGYLHARFTWTAPAVTAECWIRPTASDLTNDARIASNAWTDHSGKGYMLWLSNRTAAFSTGFLNVTGNVGLRAGVVYAVTGTYDRASGATLYIDGVAVRNRHDGNIAPNPQTGDSDTTRIGVLDATAGGFGLTDHFAGNISNCALYDRALTPAEVALHYSLGSGRPRNVAALPSDAPAIPPPPATPAPAPIVYDRERACIAGKLFLNDVLPAGEGEFSTDGFDRTWWGRKRGDPIGGAQHDGFSVSWGRRQYDTYFGDKDDGISRPADDPFHFGPDSGVAGAPNALRIDAFAMPAHLRRNPKVAGAAYYAGALDTPIRLQYGFFVARLRLPSPRPGLSPAFWMLSNDGVPKGEHGPLNAEWDVQELFGNAFGDAMNAGNIVWNSGADRPQNWGGVYEWPPTAIAETTTPASAYHDYGVLLAAGGAAISKDVYGAGGPGYVYGPAGTGTTDYLDGVPLYGHTGGADLTHGVAWKELMAMFQVSSRGFLGSPGATDLPASYWIAWIRAYRPTGRVCAMSGAREPSR